MLKRGGFLVYPALVMDQALSRCRPGTFDLIIVNATEDADSALEFRDQVRRTDPQQRLLLMSEANLRAAGDEVVSGNPERLLERVETLLKQKSRQLTNRLAA